MTDKVARRAVIVLVLLVLLAVLIFSLFRLMRGVNFDSSFFSKKTIGNIHKNVPSGASDKSTLWERMEMTRSDDSVRVQVRGRYVSRDDRWLTIQLKNSIQTISVWDQVQYECMPLTMTKMGVSGEMVTLLS
jgi:hypothetical protein